MNEPALQASRPSWDRQQHLNALSSRLYDVLVVGGGATGCATARDAVLRGLDVALVERGDLASGSSSRSTRFIHGGLRYLRTWEFGFVREGLQERGIFLTVAPHLVRPAPFLFPAFRDRGNRRLWLRTGLVVYDFLAGRNRLSGSRLLNVNQTLEQEPEISARELTGSVLFSDAVTDDVRLVVEMAVSAVEGGATVALHTEVERIIPSDSGPAVVLLKDRLSGDTFGAKAAVVLNTTGVWPGGTLQIEEGKDPAPTRSTPLRPSRGSHLVVARKTLPLSSVVVMPSRRDDRILFAVPAGDFTYLGTTEVVHTGSLDHVRAESGEVEYIREVAEETFRRGPIPPSLILSTWAGLRPLIDREDQETGTLSRDYRIVEESPGIVTVAGGKLTSCRRMAEVAVNLAGAILDRRFNRRTDPCITHWKLFPGAEGPSPSAPHEIPPGLKPAVAQHLIHNYGARSAILFRSLSQDPSLAQTLTPETVVTPAEIRYAVDREGAVRLSDLLFRRFHSLFIDAQINTSKGRRLLEAASRCMGDSLGWSESQRQLEIEAAGEEWQRVFSVPEMI